ncbi:MAG: ribonuclease III [candidate division KSB1 bacterium]|nr:ribonuclease III [candidate division KSB1 bacterium]
MAKGDGRAKTAGVQETGAAAKPRRPQTQGWARTRGVSRWKKLFAWLLPHRAAGEEKRIREIGRLIRYRFRNHELLEQALTHRSFVAGSKANRLDSNERLELLGDAVLGLAVTEYLFRRFPRKPEGELTSIKSLVVSQQVLSRVARQIRLGDHIRMSQAEERSGGRERPSILSDCLEALIGAIYLDGGFQEAMRFVRRHILAGMDALLHEEMLRNYKSELLEFAQARNWGNPVYRVVREEGPDHEKMFTVEVDVAGRARGIGTGRTKKVAEQQAAREALRQLQNQGA